MKALYTNRANNRIHMTEETEDDRSFIKCNASK